MRGASDSTAWRRRCRARRNFSGSEDQPVRSAAPWVDFGTASLLALGVAAALRVREATGEGQMSKAHCCARR